VCRVQQQVSVLCPLASLTPDPDLGNPLDWIGTICAIRVGFAQNDAARSSKAER
jgi:hypothetical protein